MADENYIFVPPDGGWGWVIVASTFMCNFLADGVMFTFGMFITTLAKDFNVTPGDIATITAVNCGFYFMTGPFVSALVNRFGFRVVGIVGGIFAMAAYAAASFAPTIDAMIVINGFLGGTALCLVYAPATIVVGFYFDKWRALANGLSTSGSGIGTLSIPVLITIVQNKYGWRITYIVLGGLLGLTSFMAALYRPIKPTLITEETKDSFWAEPKTRPKAEEREVEHVGCLSCFTCCAPDIRKVLVQTPTIAQVVDPKKVIAEDMVRPSGSTDSLTIGPVAARQSTVSRIFFGEDSRAWPRCKRRCKRCITCYNYRNNPAIRPLYRDDIFYSQSLYTLPKYKKIGKKFKGEKTPGEDAEAARARRKQKSVHIQLAVTRVRSEVQHEGCMKHCEPVLRAITSLLDCRLLKSPSFEVFSWCGFFAYFGYMIPFLYIKERALEAGISEDLAPWLLSTIGLSNTCGRIFSGLLPSLTHRISVTLYTYLMMFICGSFTCVSGLKSCLNLYVQFGFAACFGFCSSCLASLRPVICVQLYGLEQLTNAFGLQMLFYGVGSLLGTFLSGKIRDATASYEYCFYMAGSSLIVSGIMLIAVRPVRDWEIRKNIYP